MVRALGPPTLDGEGVRTTPQGGGEPQVPLPSADEAPPIEGTTMAPDTTLSVLAPVGGAPMSEVEVNKARRKQTALRIARMKKSVDMGHLGRRGALLPFDADRSRVRARRQPEDVVDVEEED